MNHNSSDLKTLSDLFSLAADGEINDEQFESLKVILKSNKAARRYYYQLVNIEVLLRDLKGSCEENQESLPAIELWGELAEYEKTAPEIEIPQVKPQRKPQRELLQKVVYPPREKRKMSKFDIFMLFNVAAVILFLVLLRFLPVREGVEVATLTDSINAKWVDVTGSMEKGIRLATRSDKLFLREGLVELFFDNNAKLVIEGPAEFELLTEDQINLQHGRVYATVPVEAIGFTINTPTSRIIDLGTEFGVQADPYGDVYLHVIKGKTTLLAGGKSNKVNLEVRGGQAKKVSATTQAVSDIPCQTELFVRDISSDHNFTWRGQKTINLADIVGGGNGFGSGEIGKGLNMSSERTQFVFTGKAHRATTEYIAVPEHDFIDGVFVPNGWKGAIQITSQGHVFKDCPVTSGSYFDEIRNGGVIRAANKKTFPMELDGQRYGTVQHPALYMHTNAGITFDLNVIRNAMPGYGVEAFRSLCGISFDIKNKRSKADIFVLIDGQLKKSASITADAQTAVDIEIKLTQNDRFLTLVSTDGGNAIASDWVMFTRPYLSLKPGSN